MKLQELLLNSLLDELKEYVESQDQLIEELTEQLFLRDMKIALMEVLLEGLHDKLIKGDVE